MKRKPNWYGIIEAHVYDDAGVKLATVVRSGEPGKAASIEQHGGQGVLRPLSAPEIRRIIEALEWASKDR